MSAALLALTAGVILGALAAEQFAKGLLRLALLMDECVADTDEVVPPATRLVKIDGGAA